MLRITNSWCDVRPWERPTCSWCSHSYAAPFSAATRRIYATFAQQRVLDSFKDGTRTIASLRSPGSFPFVRIAPKSEFHPCATGGTWSSAASKDVIPLAPRRSRMASAMGDVPGGGYLPGITRDGGMKSEGKSGCNSHNRN